MALLLPRHMITRGKSWNHRISPKITTCKRNILSSTQIQNKNVAVSMNTKHRLHLTRYHSASTSISEKIVKSPYQEISVPNIPLAEFMWKNVNNWPNKTALECGVTGRSYTYAQARDLSWKFGRALLNLGFSKGDVLGIILPNIPEYAIAFLGTVEVGVIVTTINPIYTPDEIHKQLHNGGAKGVITIPDLFPNVQKATQSLQNFRSTIIIGDAPPGCVNFQEILQNSKGSSDTSKVNIDPEDTIVLPYSSGTTGVPKGVMLSHNNLSTNILQFSYGAVSTFQQAHGDHQDVIPAVLPFFHIYGMVCCLLSKLIGGAKIVTLPKFEPILYLQTIEKHKGTMLYVVPPILLFLGSHPDVKPRYLNSVHTVVSGAAPVGPMDIERFLKVKKDVTFQQGYGMTEASPVTNLSEAFPTAFKPATVGFPVPTTCAKIIDASTGNTLGPNETGELCVKGPQVMKGYLNNKEATAQTIDTEEWLHTGDIGYYDEDSHFYIVDRLKELIKVKGFQVAPAELEELLRSHPDISDAGVIGVPHETKGEVPYAFVVSAKASLTKDDIHKFIDSKVAPFKKLEGGILLTDSIPKAASGKILRKELRALYKKDV